MKEVALHGMVSSRNFGDILMVDIVARFLATQQINVSVPMGNESVLKDLNILEQTNRGYWGFNKCDSLVFTGGGYFGPMSNRNFSKDIRMMIKFASPAEFFLSSSQHHIIGVGVNNLNKFNLTQYYMKRFFNAAGTITVRDEESLSELRKIGVVRTDIEVLADIALNIQVSSIPSESLKYAEDKLAYLNKNYEKIIALHLSDLPEATCYNSIYDGILKYANEYENIGFVLIEDHPNSVSDSPQLLAAQYLKSLLMQRAEIIPYSYHWNLVAILSKVDGIVTNKLHVAIVSSALNKVAVSFTKHEKNHRFFSQINAKERCINLPDQTKDSVYMLMKNEFSCLNRGDLVPSSIRNLARRNLDLLAQNLVK